MVCFCASCAKVKVALNDIVAACGIVRWSSKWRYKWIVFCARKSLLVKVRQNLMDNTGFLNTATFGDTPAMDLSGRALGHWACAERFNVPGAARSSPHQDACGTLNSPSGRLAPFFRHALPNVGHCLALASTSAYQRSTARRVAGSLRTLL